MLSVIILAAGHGSRMHGRLPKVAQCVAGQPMLKHVYDVASQLDPAHIFVVCGQDAQHVQEILADTPVQWVEQHPPRGTGDAVKQAAIHLPDVPHQVLILYGDVPFACPDQLKDLLHRTEHDGFGLVTALPPQAGHLGRIVRDKDRRVQAIVEFVDATDAQRNISEVFSGMMVVPSDFLKVALANLQPNNQQKEYYLTDILLAWLAEGRHVETCIMRPWWRAQGVNTLSEMATLERAYQHNKAEQLMAQGVKIIDPLRFDCRGTLEVGHDVHIDVNVVIEGQVRLGNGVRIAQNVVLKDVVIGDHSHVRANSVLEGAVLHDHVTVGPFAYVRPDSELASHSKVGSFVELKKTKLGPYSKANHLSYLGDCHIGQSVNIGAGFISCNYDGTHKHTTTIGDYCFVGAGCQLVAPITLDAGVMVGAGTCLRGNVAARTLVVDRGTVEHIQGWPKLTKWVEKKQKEGQNHDA